ncbi:unnamed protein product [Rotaria sordida]|uniref:Uncharacterized protein n=1 Tax=Rotaria sordida TaxID=392033 RepID=A0A814UIZ8_9BILA|nr:unnamed protein product [Rotaria sordida]CAF3991025.1 unnamed protein product [Rotaria sordida]
MPIYISKNEVAITSITSVDDLFYVQYSFDVDIDSSVTGIVKNLDEVKRYFITIPVAEIISTSVILLSSGESDTTTVISPTNASMG